MIWSGLLGFFIFQENFFFLWNHQIWDLHKHQTLKTWKTSMFTAHSSAIYPLFVQLYVFCLAYSSKFLICKQNKLFANLHNNSFDALVSSSAQTHCIVGFLPFLICCTPCNFEISWNPIQQFKIMNEILLRIYLNWLLVFSPHMIACKLFTWCITDDH